MNVIKWQYFELPIVQMWSEIILVISNQFEIAHMISDQIITLHSVQFPLLTYPANQFKFS